MKGVIEQTSKNTKKGNPSPSHTHIHTYTHTHAHAHTHTNLPVKYIQAAITQPTITLFLHTVLRPLKHNPLLARMPEQVLAMGFAGKTGGRELLARYVAVELFQNGHRHLVAHVLCVLDEEGARPATV